MPSQPDATLPTDVIRGAIDFRRFPWVRPLVTEHATNFDAVAPLFAGNPTNVSDWRDTIARVQQAPRAHRAVIAGIVGDQIARRGGPADALDNARRLASEHAVAIVTGQQAGAFGGPLYTVLKAVTAIQLARRVEQEQGVPVVPVFWVDSEDHDWDEVQTTTALDRDFAPANVELPAPDHAGTFPIGALVLNGDVELAVAEFEQAVAATEFTPEVVAALQRRYCSGATVSSAFAGWIEDLLGHHGLVVFEADDARAKPIAAEMFAAELRNPARTCDLVREGGATMARLGHPPQLEQAADVVNLFYLDANGRRAIKRRGDHYAVGDAMHAPDALVAEALAHPEHFSPNVVLRPLVQDLLFPTACYVAGPSELAYQAQLGGVYSAFGVAQPMLFSRASATLLDAAAARFLERHDVAFESLQTQDESVLNRLLESQLPASIEQAITETEQHLGAQADVLRRAVTTVDPTLAGAVDTTIVKIRDTIKSLQGKIVQASKKKDETLRRQFVRTRALAFPAGQPQERLLGVAFFANRYGPRFADRLIETLPADTSRHYLITL